jgi:hypothetical protein
MVEPGARNARTMRGSWPTIDQAAAYPYWDSGRQAVRRATATPHAAVTTPGTAVELRNRPALETFL